MKTKVNNPIEESRPYAQDNSGDVELTEVDEKNGVLGARLKGTCHDRRMAQTSLQLGLDQSLKKKNP